MAFNIGDRVRVKDYEEIADHLKVKNTGDDPSMWNAGKAKCCGLKGEIVDIMYSTAYEKYIYRIHFDEQAERSRADFTEEALELLHEDSVSYHFETDIAEDNVVIVIMYEDHEDGSSKEVGRGHGHIIHEGALGIAQATSYGMYRLYKRLEENNF
jgi:hypothetical protein